MDLQAAIKKAASNHDIREDILSALVWQESRGNPFAFRFEPLFYDRRIRWRKRQGLAGFVPMSIPTLDTEKILRSSSFGLCQLLGETLRTYLASRSQYLTAYFDPELNLDAGAKFLAHLLSRTGGDYTKALRLYNGSSTYPDLILDHVKKKSYLAMFT